MVFKHMCSFKINDTKVPMGFMHAAAISIIAADMHARTLPL